MVNADKTYNDTKGIYNYVFDSWCVPRSDEKKSFIWYFCVTQIVNISIYWIPKKVSTEDYGMDQSYIELNKSIGWMLYATFVCERNSFITIVNGVVNLFGWPLFENDMRFNPSIPIINFADGKKLNQIRQQLGKTFWHNIVIKIISKVLYAFEMCVNEFLISDLIHFLYTSIPDITFKSISR